MTFDQRPCLGANLGDLYLAPFRDEYLPRVVSAEVLAENGRSVEEQLASLRLFDLKRGAPTYAGVILFGIEPRTYVPGAYVQVVRYDGDSVLDPVEDQREIAGNLGTQLRALDEYLPSLVTTPLRESSGGMRMEPAPTYPRLALRELMWNALLHRNYESTAPVRLTVFPTALRFRAPADCLAK